MTHKSPSEADRFIDFLINVPNRYIEFGHNIPFSKSLRFIANTEGEFTASRTEAVRL